ncbi:MAG: GTPase HflX [Thermoguttaceae bacterium]|nr:GTPase HflX [Planctomycetaceae bacterium]MBQ4143174.1 GTPase HflX [Thermoguttaceae bacterium]
MEERNSGTILNEKSFLVTVLLPQRPTGGVNILGETGEEPLDELRGLAEAAGTVVVGEMVQRRSAIEPSTYIGSGKVLELKGMLEKTEADVVIFDNDLAPGQTRNLEKELNVKVLDRTELILDIFASRAQTKEARLAVELAQLEYSLPRLKRMWTHLSRQKKGVGLRGPGETQLETDRRLAQKRIADLKAELTVVQQRKEREVKSRSQTRTVSLVGYTNAGKSTLLNALTGSDVYVKDQLFATLDTRTRRWTLPGWGPILLSDTVGFVRNLPHHLVASFRATLEEARCADLLLHVADGSNPMVMFQIQAAYEVLEHLGIEEKDTILVINKIDAFKSMDENGELPTQYNLQALLNRYPNAMGISARTGEGLPELAQAVSDMLSRHFPTVEVEMSITNGKLAAYLANHGEVFSRQYRDDGSLVIRCRIAGSFLGKIRNEEMKMTLIDGELPVFEEEF